MRTTYKKPAPQLPKGRMHGSHLAPRLPAPRGPAEPLPTEPLPTEPLHAAQSHKIRSTKTRSNTARDDRARDDRTLGEKNLDDKKSLGDLRFKQLLPAHEWAALPPAIQRRFTKRLGPNQTALYLGKVVYTKLTPIGTCFAHLARLIGAPLPTSADIQGPAIVTVTEDPLSGGQVWTRSYMRPGHFPQTINSAKRFCGPTGLEEYVGLGISMALTVCVEDEQLIFRSAHYCCTFGNGASNNGKRQIKLKLPLWLTPGRIEVIHREEPGEQFSFTLKVTHPLFGVIMEQKALFKEVLQ